MIWYLDKDHINQIRSGKRKQNLFFYLSIAGFLVLLFLFIFTVVNV